MAKFSAFGTQVPRLTRRICPDGQRVAAALEEIWEKAPSTSKISSLAAGKAAPGDRIVVLPRSLRCADS
jgi:hypothetical protein